AVCARQCRHSMHVGLLLSFPSRANACRMSWFRRRIDRTGNRTPHSAFFSIMLCGESTMPSRGFFALLSVLATIALSDAAAQDRPKWSTYVDPDTGTAVEYPTDIFSIEEGAPEMGTGKRFRS